MLSDLGESSLEVEVTMTGNVKSYLSSVRLMP